MTPSAARSLAAPGVAAELSVPPPLACLNEPNLLMQRRYFVHHLLLGHLAVVVLEGVLCLVAIDEAVQFCLGHNT